MPIVILSILSHYKGWESVLTIAISTLYGSLVTSASPYKQVNTAQLYVACADSDCTCIYTRNSSSTLDLFIIINYLHISKLYCFWWAVKAVVQCGWWEFNNGVSGNKVRELYTIVDLLVTVQYRIHSYLLIVHLYVYKCTIKY